MARPSWLAGLFGRNTRQPPQNYGGALGATGSTITSISTFGGGLASADDIPIATEKDALSVTAWTSIMIKVGGLLSRLRLRVVDDEMNEMEIPAVEIWQRDVDVSTLFRYQYDWGNAVVVMDGDRGLERMMMPHPSRVRWHNVNGRLVCHVNNKPIEPERLLHFASPIKEGRFGHSMRDLCSRELGIAVLSSQYAGATFTKDPQGSLVLVDRSGAGGSDLDEGGEGFLRDGNDGQDRVASTRTEGGSLPFRGRRSRGTALELSGDYTVTQLQPRAREAQLTESRDYQGREICRFLAFPPVLFGFQEGTSVYGPGIRAIERSFYTTRMSPEIGFMTQVLDSGLLLPGSGLKFDFDASDITSLDRMEQAEVTMKQLPFITINEARMDNGKGPLMMADGVTEDPRGYELITDPGGFADEGDDDDGEVING